jgi:Protein of unknown function (DUF3800)
MAYFLFVDESGSDRKCSPYEVLAGIAIRDSDLWSFISELHNAELRNFGRRYSDGIAECKGTKLLKSKVFIHAALNVPLKPEEIVPLAKDALDNGPQAKVGHFRALALAKLAYVRDVLGLCARYRCRAFASIVETDADQTATDGLRKDYAYLFERFFYYLEDRQTNEQGLIIFDELEKTRSHLLVDQAHKYFKESAVGRYRSGLIIPEPFFVHSELTTGIQVADIIAYIISWGFRTAQMTKPARPELEEFAGSVAQLRYRATRERHNNPDFFIWSFAHIWDLRTRQEKGYIE